jgi:hypothetical protein
MPLQTIPQFPIIININMVSVRTCEVKATLRLCPEKWCGVAPSKENAVLLMQFLVQHKKINMMAVQFQVKFFWVVMPCIILL